MTFADEDQQVFSEEEILDDTEKKQLDLQCHLEKLNLDDDIRTTESEHKGVDIEYKLQPEKNDNSSEKGLDFTDSISNIDSALIYQECTSVSDVLAFDGNIDFQNPRSEKRTVDSSSASNLPTSNDPLPPPEELGCGHPFLLFVCLAVLLQERDQIMESKMEYDDMVMHFDKMARKHSPCKVLSKAMRLFAEYLRSDSCCSYSST